MLLPHGADEANAPAGQRLDQALLGPVIADRGSDRVDPGGQSRLGNDPAAPDVRDQIIFADDAFTVAEQVLKKIKHLGLDRNEARATAQLPSLGVEDVILEQIQQFMPRLRGLPTAPRPARIKGMITTN